MLNENQIQELVIELEELKKKYPYKFYELKGIVKCANILKDGKKIDDILI